jgi:glycosyltransferase involved in cell wall biosynthesis
VYNLLRSAENNLEGRRVFFITRSTGDESLSNDDFTSSSQAYESSLIKALSEITLVNVKFLGDCASSKVPHSHATNGMIQCECYGGLRLKTFLKLLVDFIGESKKGQTVVITTGYYPVEMLLLVASKIFGVRVYSIVYDTHISAEARMPIVKKIISKIYLGLGFYLLRKLDGVIVLNDIFTKLINVNSRVHLTKIGNLFKPPVLSELASMEIGSEKRRFIFAGNLNLDNGVDIILGALKKDKNLNFEVFFFGDGEGVQKVIEASIFDTRVHYMGRVSDYDLNIHILSSDYLICLRNPDSITCAYSFPSKLIKFMGSGRPVISNKFPGLGDEYIPHLIIIPEFTIDSCLSTISALENRPVEFELGSNAKIFIEANNNWSKIANGIYNFIFYRK